jgi:hypothetical protein
MRPRIHTSFLHDHYDTNLLLGSIHVGFVVDKVALGQFFLVLPFSPANIIPLSFSMLIYHLGDEQYIR